MNVGARLADTDFELDDTRREGALVVLVERRNPLLAGVPVQLSTRPCCRKLGAVVLDPEQAGSRLTGRIV
jgi:hypothetical protein